MSDFLDKLENHRELMQQRGYDEIGLGSPDEPGHYMKQLEFLFSSCVEDSRLHSKTRKDFYIDAYGFFNNDIDLVWFKFHYEFDPIKKDIELKSFIAKMDGIQYPVLLGRNMYDLPQASRIYKILSDARQLQKANQLINREENVTQNRKRFKI